jgi:hypothetical protein
MLQQQDQLILKDLEVVGSFVSQYGLQLCVSVKDHAVKKVELIRLADRFAG